MDINKNNGEISVQTEHIFPIIKKWLYSEKDIFLREIVSNAADAVTKLKRLEALGKYSCDVSDYKISVSLDRDAKTITVTDNGIGMSKDELINYICQIALSGALDFISKYEGSSESSASDAAQNGIIGHFGLGFYSSFMVSGTVEIVTRSYLDGEAVHWICNDTGDYSFSDPTDEQLEIIDSHGTAVIMHILDTEAEYLNGARLRSMLDKYCAFMPVDIYFNDGEEHSHENCNDECNECKSSARLPINCKQPLWLKQPSACTKEEYIEFYQKVFNDFREPLFWIHINADYPLNFKGIFYFPSVSNEYEPLECQVKLFYNQVFVADNIKEIMPEYLLMLRGVVDCPELPLNVSRSYLQTNTYISRVSSHIAKKVSDKLSALYNTEREEYEKIWNSIRTFVEYACILDRKFYDRVKSAIILKATDNSYISIDEYIESAKEKHENTIYYTTDAALQAQHISMLAAQGITSVVLDHIIDTQFISSVEKYSDNIRFVCVNSGVADALKSNEQSDKNEALEALFKKVSNDSELKIEFVSLKDDSVPAFINITEDFRRFEEMMKRYGAVQNGIPSESTLVINLSSPIVSKLDSLCESKPNEAEAIASYVYKLALLSLRKLSADEMKSFMDDSYNIIMMI